MKRFCTALSAALWILGIAGCNDYGNTFQGNTGAVLLSVSPSNVSAGNPDLTITVVGSGFVKQTVVEWNGQKLKTTPDFAGDGVTVLDLKAVVPATLLKTPGLFDVNTLNPFSGTGNNGLSNVVVFMVNSAPNPVPTVSSLSPACAQTGSAALALAITGTNFLPPSTNQTSTVSWQPAGGFTSQLTATVSSSTQIQATVPANLLTTAGPVNVTVSNPPSLPANFAGATGSGGGTSAPAAFTVQAATCPLAARKPAGAESAAESAAVVEETPSVSTDGRFLAYTAALGDHTQIFLHDNCGTDSSCQPRTQLISAAEDGTAGNDDSRSPSLSGDGRWIAFSSAASNLVAGAPAGRQIYLRDTCHGADSGCRPSVQLISVDANGALVGTENILPSISSSGRFVAFLSVTAAHGPKSGGAAAANAATSGESNSGFRQVFVRDTCFGASNCTPSTKRISLQPGDASNEAKPSGPALSGNAKEVAGAGAATSTLFTRSIRVDDSVFLAVTQ